MVWYLSLNLVYVCLFVCLFLMMRTILNLLNLLHYYFCVIFCFFGCEVCGILVPWSGIEPTPPTLEGKVLTTGLLGKSLLYVFKGLSMFTFFFPFIFIRWRLITLQYCSGFCHTLTWISHGFTCVPHVYFFIYFFYVYFLKTVNNWTKFCPWISVAMALLPTIQFSRCSRSTVLDI